jgi:hypothetical protein
MESPFVDGDPSGLVVVMAGKRAPTNSRRIAVIGITVPDAIRRVALPPSVAQAAHRTS